MTPSHFNRILNNVERRLLPFENLNLNCDKSEIDYLQLNVNPIKTSLHIISMLKQIEKQWQKSYLRASKLTSILQENTQKFLKTRYFPQELLRQIKQIDIFGKTALTYLEQHDAFKILETNVLDSIMIDLWSSKLDTCGSFFEMSTSMNIIRYWWTDQTIDYEKNHRFYSERRVQEVRPHSFIFQKFCKSIQLKFLIEILIWGLLAIIFQYYTTLYTSGTLECLNLWNNYPDNIKAYYEILQAQKNGTSLNTPYFQTYLKYIEGNNTLQKQTILEFSENLRTAQYVMILQYMCALQAPLLFVYTTYFQRKF